MASAGPPGAPSPRSLPPPAPPQNAPPNLRRSANHRCLGVPAEPRTGPSITGAPKSEERSATAARSEFWGAAPREDSGWGRRGAHGAWGARPAISPSSHPCHLGGSPRHLRRPRAADAAELGRLRRPRQRRLLRGSPRRRAVEGKPWCRREGTRLAEGRLSLRG